MNMQILIISVVQLATSQFAENSEFIQLFNFPWFLDIGNHGHVSSIVALVPLSSQKTSKTAVT